MKLSRLQLLLMNSLHKKKEDLQHTVVVGEVPVAREKVGEVDIAQREVEVIVGELLTEIVVAGVVSGSFERFLTHKLIYHPAQLTALGEMVNSKGGGRVRKDSLRIPSFALIHTYVYQVTAEGETVSGEVEVKVGNQHYELRSRRLMRLC